MERIVRMALVPVLFLLSTSCDSTAPGGQQSDADEEPDVIEDVVGETHDEQDTVDVVDPGLSGFIGSPCAGEADCDYGGAVCLTSAPSGMCSLECDLYCPDREGHPMTFCMDEASLPVEMPGFTEGACFSRCDWALFPGTGCREGYGCVSRPRANEPGTMQLVCVPGEGDPLTGCLDELASLGVFFEPSSSVSDHPDGFPDLTCVVEQPVMLHSPVHGVNLESYYSGSPGSVYVACSAAVAIVRTVDDVAPLGVVAIQHMGTYNCRVIAGTSTLSRHAYGDAIDIAGFELDDGTVYTLYDDWEHDTETPVTPGGSFLYAAAGRWYEAWIWNTILTPNYNSDHDDHFHVDLTPDRHFLKSVVTLDEDGRYMGPAPFDD